MFLDFKNQENNHKCKRRGGVGMGRYDNKVKNNATITNMTNSKSFCGLTCMNYCTFACKGTSTKSTRPSAISTKN